MKSSPNAKTRILATILFSCHLFAIATSNQDQQRDPRNVMIDEALNPQIDIADLEKQEFLTAHNKVRHHVDEPFFVWDSGLAYYAGQYGRKRAADCDLVHSGGPYGENLFWGSGNEWTPTDVVRLWIREHRHYDRETNTCEPGKMCGHFTQIVWRSSIRLGCARVRCDCGDIFAICSYDPPGNYIGERPFDYID